MLEQVAELEQMQKKDAEIVKWKLGAAVLFKRARELT